MKTVQVFLRDERAIAPTRNKLTDAGLDLYAMEDKFIELGSTAVVRTGVSINIPQGAVGKIEDRSSLASKGLRTGAGVVDAGYSGEVGVVIHNLTSQLASDPVLHRRGYQIRRGDKIAQLLTYAVETPTVEVVSNLWESERGSRGFGSSGR
jgi:dUTP pyrophosphatase